MRKVKEPKLPKPGIRIDGGSRRDLNRDRVAQRMAGVMKPGRTPGQVEADQKARRKAADRSRGQTTKLKREDGGKDGSKLTAVKIKVSALRTDRTVMRCKPGSFEWRYGRNKQGVEFHAGSHLAILWERAGMTIASSSDFLRGVTSGYPSGVSDGRVAAMDKLGGFRTHLGIAGTERMIDYCVIGLTTAEIALKKNMGQREMSTVLHADLKETAKFLDFVPGKRRVNKRRSGIETN